MRRIVETPTQVLWWKILASNTMEMQHRSQSFCVGRPSRLTQMRLAYGPIYNLHRIPKICDANVDFGSKLFTSNRLNVDTNVNDWVMCVIWGFRSDAHHEPAPPRYFGLWQTLSLSSQPPTYFSPSLHYLSNDSLSIVTSTILPHESTPTVDSLSLSSLNVSFPDLHLHHHICHSYPEISIEEMQF